MATVLTRNGASLIANVYVGKYVGLIRQDGTEVDGKDYARQTVPSLSVSSDDTNFYFTNSTDIVFPVAGSDWATTTNMINKINIYDSATAGNVLATVDLAVAKPCFQGDQIKILAGSLKIT
ncbi:MAG: phage tail fiber protein, partial [Thermoprotei archaeon]